MPLGRKPRKPYRGHVRRTRRGRSVRTPEIKKLVVWLLSVGEFQSFAEVGSWFIPYAGVGAFQRAQSTICVVFAGKRLSVPMVEIIRRVSITDKNYIVRILAARCR